MAQRMDKFNVVNLPICMLAFFSAKLAGKQLYLETAFLYRNGNFAIFILYFEVKLEVTYMIASREDAHVSNVQPLILQKARTNQAYIWNSTVQLYPHDLLHVFTGSKYTKFN